MIHALKNRFGVVSGVEQLRQELKGQYDYYPRGIAKVEIDRSVRMRDWVNLYLDDQLDFEIFREIADENGYVYENDSSWFGFYEASDLNADPSRGSLLGNFNKTGPVPFNVSLLGYDSMDDFRLWVVASYLQKTYENSVRTL